MAHSPRASPASYLDYLELEFKGDQLELTRTRELVERIATGFARFLVSDAWPYEVLQDGGLAAPEKYSQSTNAMILFALAAANGSVHPGSLLVPVLDARVPVQLKDQWQAYEGAWARLVRETYSEGASSGPVTRSGSFGDDDPFTLNWLLELFRCDALRSVTNASEFAGISAWVLQRALDRAQKALDLLPQIALAVPSTGSLLRFGSSESALAPDHAFVVLRFLQLLRTADASSPRTVGVGLKRYFENRCYEQLSKNELADGEFDAAELVFALEGLLILDAQSTSVALINRIFEVLLESQDLAPHWRPVKPLVTYAQGQVLFPLSVETAHSLLRCTSLLATAGADEACFSRHILTFKRYVAWLWSRLRKGRLGNGNEFEGWHSEHVHLHHGIHLWETSQVILFLGSYAEMLDRHIARSALAAVELTKRRPQRPKNGPTLTAFWESGHRAEEPLGGLATGSPLRVFDRVGDGFVRSRDPSSPDAPAKRHSMLLSGPPGTGKTNFAEELARALDYPLIIVTPTDFVRGGESQVEERAKRLFDVLGAQSNVVILLDEIDRMIIDRDADAYEKQSDIFQFMTPSMLTKLADLRKTKRVVFLVGTNYEEHIDPAAKRVGRIDERFILAPPDLSGRLAIMQRLIIAERSGEAAARFAGEASRNLDPAARATALMVFSELKQLVEAAQNGLSKEERQDLIRVAVAVNATAARSAPPAITLESYRSRLTTTSYKQRPFLEFFVLLYIKAEVEGRLTTEELGLAEDAVRILVGLPADEWAALSGSEKSSRARPLLENQINDSRVVNTIVSRLWT